jgi:hypothetical protein
LATGTGGLEEVESTELEQFLIIEF